METRRITLSSINADDKRYQVRDPRTSPYGERIDQEKASRRHIQTIVKALNDNPKKRIEPIEVVEDPKKYGQYIIVDGFHRYGAYRQIFKNTKGKRFKQIRVKVHTEGVTLDRALSINTEHTALSLTSSQRTELQWQQFLNLMSQDNPPSIKKTSEILGIQTSTVSNWRKLKNKFEEAGFFDKKSNVDKNPITGFPMLRPSREALKRDEWSSVDEETTGALTEDDKATARQILEKAKCANEPDKLAKFIRLYLGEPLNAIDFDISIDELEQENEGSF